MTYTLDQIKKILEPFPWQQQGLFLEGTQAVRPFMPPLIATVERDDEKSGTSSPADLAHAAYLTHAANVVWAVDSNIEEVLSATKIHCAALTQAFVNPPPEIADVLEGLAISISKLHDLRKQINTITTNP